MTDLRTNVSDSDDSDTPATDHAALHNDVNAKVNDLVNNPPAALAGVSIVRAFPFAFDTPNILTGASLYTPTVGDILLDAWIQVDTAWGGGGSVVLGDIGTFVDSEIGFWQNGALGMAIDMTRVDMEAAGAGYVSWPQFGNLNAPLSASNLFSNNAGRNVPGRFTATNPIKICVSYTGRTDGADPGSTQGAGVLYLVTATPVQP